MLLSMSSCVFCLNGKNTPCFATYDDGYKCFSCGKYKTSSDYAFKNSSVTTVKTGLQLVDVTTNVKHMPLWACEYLYKHFVTQEMMNKYKIYYSKSLDNLIFTIYNEHNELVFYQTRSREKQITTHGVRTPQELFKKNSRNSCVIVEDFVSCIRLNNINNNTHCLFGTSLSNELCEYLITRFTEIIIYLDGDEAGRVGANKLLDRLEKAVNKINNKKPFLMSEKRIITIISTAKDPKCYSDAELHNILKSRFL